MNDFLPYRIQNRLAHELRTPNEAFFIQIPNFWSLDRPQSAGINVQSLQSATTPRRLILLYIQISNNPNIHLEFEFEFGHQELGI